MSLKYGSPPLNVSASPVCTNADSYFLQQLQPGWNRRIGFGSDSWQGVLAIRREKKCASNTLLTQADTRPAIRNQDCAPHLRKSLLRRQALCSQREGRSHPRRAEWKAACRCYGPRTFCSSAHHRSTASAVITTFGGRDLIKSCQRMPAPIAFAWAAFGSCSPATTIEVSHDSFCPANDLFTRRRYRPGSENRNAILGSTFARVLTTS